MAKEKKPIIKDDIDVEEIIKTNNSLIKEVADLKEKLKSTMANKTVKVKNGSVRLSDEIRRIESEKAAQLSEIGKN